MSARPIKPARGIILPIVLVMVGLLALTMAGFIFFVRAEAAGIRAATDGKQAQLAVESAFEETQTKLRESQHDISVWYDAPSFRHALVWGEAFDRASDPVAELGSRERYFERNPSPRAAWRWSAVAERLDGPEGTIRFGLTPETGKLNINTASDDQIAQLVTPILLALAIENSQQIVDAILDWRDADGTARGQGAESEYYNTMLPPYNAKNAKLDTIEELLLVKGVTAAILYGEDANRNGILDGNENDGDASAPDYDNGDGVLDRGIAPYLTVFSREPDTALDNKPRIPLAAGAGMAPFIEKYIPADALSEETKQFLMSLQQRGVTVSMLTSPAYLYPLGPDEELELGQPTSQPTGQSGEQLGGTSEQNGDSKSGDADGRESDQTGEQSGEKDGSRSQQKDEKQPESGEPPKDGSGTGGGAENSEQKQPTGNRGGQSTGGRQSGGGATSQPTGQSGGSAQQLQRMTEALRASPVRLEEMPIIMDRFTTKTPQAGTASLMEGLININTAPARVLLLIPGMTPEAAGALLSARQKADPATLATTAWPLTTGAVDPATFRRIAPYITTKSYQFHLEAIGYADHTRLMRRYEWVIEMIGPLAQVKYFRDLSPLGMGWPIDIEQQVITK